MRAVLVLEVQVRRVVEVDVGLRGSVDVELVAPGEPAGDDACERPVGQAHLWRFLDVCAGHGSTVPGDAAPAH